MGALYSLPSQLSHRLTLQSRAERTDESGDQILTWTTRAQVWAAMIDSQVERREEGQQMEEVAQHRLVIRFRKDIASGWRFLLQGRELSIRTVIDPDQTKRFLICQCEEPAR